MSSFVLTSDKELPRPYKTQTEVTGFVVVVSSFTNNFVEHVLNTTNGYGKRGSPFPSGLRSKTNAEVEELVVGHERYTELFAL